MSDLTATDIATEVTACQKAVTNALNDSAIMSVLAKQGYTQAKMQTGLDAARALQTNQAATGTTLGAQAGATTTVVSSFKTAHLELQLLRDKGRELYPEKDESAWSALKLDKEVPRGQNTFITFGTDTIDNILNDDALKAALASEGYDEARLQEIRTTIQTAASDDRSQEAAKGTRRGTTKSRDDAEKAFLRWWTPFKKAARRLLTDAQLTTLDLS